MTFAGSVDRKDAEGVSLVATVRLPMGRLVRAGCVGVKRVEERETEDEAIDNVRRTEKAMADQRDIDVSRRSRVCLIRCQDERRHAGVSLL